MGQSADASCSQLQRTVLVTWWLFSADEPAGIVVVDVVVYGRGSQEDQAAAVLTGRGPAPPGGSQGIRQWLAVDTEHVQLRRSHHAPAETLLESTQRTSPGATVDHCTTWSKLPVPPSGVYFRQFITSCASAARRVGRGGIMFSTCPSFCACVCTWREQRHSSGRYKCIYHRTEWPKYTLAASPQMPPRYNLKFELTDGQTDTEPML